MADRLNAGGPLPPDQNTSPYSDFGAGILFALAGLGGLVFGRSLSAGSIARMGPGFFPLAVSGGLVVIGAVLVARGLRQRRPDPVPFGWETAAWLIAALAAFALLVDPGGLIAAVAAASLLATTALRRAERQAGIARPLGRTAIEGLALATVLAGGSALVFIAGLGLPIRPWP